MPVQGSQARVVSDLIPTAAITEDWPVIGVTTYGDIEWRNLQLDENGVSHFDAYVLQKTEADFHIEDFTRLYFVLTQVPNVVNDKPYLTKWVYEDIIFWPPVLEKIRFTRDYNIEVEVETAAGSIFLPKIYVDWKYRPAFRGHTRIKDEFYLSTQPFDLSGVVFDMPQTGDVSWDIDPLGQSGSMGECLHHRIPVPAAHPQTGFLNGIYHELFEATNHTSWQVYTFAFEVTEVSDVFYVGRKRTAYPPPLTPLTRKKI